MGGIMPANRIVYMISACALVIGTLCLAAPTPELGSRANIDFSHYQAASMGRSMLMKLNNKNALINDPLAQSYLQNIAETVADPIRRNGKKTHLFIINSNAVNAVAMPGGYIGINTGLILRTKTESQLAAVIAHETVHVMQNHIARMISAAKRHKVPYMLGLAAAAGLSLSGNGGAATGAAMSGMAASAESQLSFTRQEEQEADHFGILALAESKYNPQGMLDFLHLMHNQDPSSLGQNTLHISSHPHMRTRISEANNRLAQIKAQAHKSSLRYYLFKARIIALTAKDKHNTSKYLLQNNTAQQYLRALELGNKRQWQTANQIASRLSEQHPEQWWFSLLSARSSAHYDKKLSLKLYSQLLDYYPGNKVIFSYAVEDYTNMHYYQKAKALIMEQIKEAPRNPGLYALLADTLSKSGNHASATLNLSKAALLAGNAKYAAALIGTIKKKYLTNFERQQMRGITHEIKRKLALSSNLRQNKRP
jgi:beta-barrel assembly-enhancing protease